jgi:hypothetical protein
MPTFINKKNEYEDVNVNKIQIIEHLRSKKASMVRCNKGWLPFHYGKFTHF